MSVERAMGEHDELLAMAGKLRRVAVGRVAPELAHALLGEFASRVAEHRDHETHAVYEPLLIYAQEKSVEFEAVLNGMLTDATSDWSSYRSYWTPERMQADWTGFGAETTRVLDRGRARLCLENDILYPLALREGLIPLRHLQR